MPERLPCPIPSSSPCSNRCAREGRQAVSCRLHGRGQDDGGPGARASAPAGGWKTSIERIEATGAPELWPRSSRQQGEPYFRQLERMALGELLPLRHVVVATGGGTFVEAGQPGADAGRWRGGLAGSAADAGDRARAGRRPPAARLGPRADGAAVRATATRLRARARADRRRAARGRSRRALCSSGSTSDPR